VVEENGSDIVEVAIQGEEASSCLVGPDLDLVVVAATDEEGLGSVEVASADGAVVFLEAINQVTHAVVPKLDGGRVKGDENPWPVKAMSAGTQAAPVRLGADLFGWNAMPLAREDFDSNREPSAVDARVWKLSVADLGQHVVAGGRHSCGGGEAAASSIR
jgi:hypothetical protein